MTTRVTTTCDMCGRELSSIITGGMTWQQAQMQAVGWFEHILFDREGNREAHRHFCTLDHLVEWLKKEAA